MALGASQSVVVWSVVNTNLARSLGDRVYHDTVESDCSQRGRDGREQPQCAVRALEHVRRADRHQIRQFRRATGTSPGDRSGGAVARAGHRDRIAGTQLPESASDVLDRALQTIGTLLDRFRR